MRSSKKIVCAVVPAVCICVLFLFISKSAMADKKESIPEMRYSDGRLTLKAVDASLLALIETISKLARFDVFIAKDFISGNISANIEDQPLEDALKHILINCSYAAIYSKDKDSCQMTALKIYPKSRYTGDIVPAFSDGRGTESAMKAQNTKTVLVSSGEDVITYGGLKDGGLLIPSLSLPNQDAGAFVSTDAPWFGLQKRMEHNEIRMYEDLMLMRRKLESADDLGRKEVLALAYAEEVDRFYAMKVAHLNKIEGLKRIFLLREMSGQ